MTEEKKKGFFSRLFEADRQRVMGSCCIVQIVEETGEDTKAGEDEDQRKNGETG